MRIHFSFLFLHSILKMGSISLISIKYLWYLILTSFCLQHLDIEVFVWLYEIWRRKWNFLKWSWSEVTKWFSRGSINLPFSVLTPQFRVHHRQLNKEYNKTIGFFKSIFSLKKSHSSCRNGYPKTLMYLTNWGTLHNTKQCIFVSHTQELRKDIIIGNWTFCYFKLCYWREGEKQ